MNIDKSDGISILQCSICGFNYVKLTDAGGRADGRITLVFKCEKGHDFEIELKHYKGYTLISDYEVTLKTIVERRILVDGTS